MHNKGVGQTIRPVRLIRSGDDFKFDGLFGPDGEFVGEGQGFELWVRKLEVPILEYGGEHEDPFHPREALADAVPGSAAEGEVRKLGA